MIGKDYLLEQPPPPSAPKVFLDQKILPLAINTAGAVESRLDAAAIRIRKAPFPALTAALGAGTLFGLLIAQRRS